MFDNTVPTIENEVRFDLGTRVKIVEKYGDSWYKGYEIMGPFHNKNKS